MEVLKAIEPLKNIETSEKCLGNWIMTDSFNDPIKLDIILEENWDASSIPSIVQNTIFNKNKVIIGHNNCVDGFCNSPTTDFAQILNSKIGDNFEACINDRYLNGTITFSSPVNEKDRYIMSSWLGDNSATLFTCYGECSDKNCNSTKSRWAVGVEF
ncbi:MAG: hypothetical protein Q9M91_04395 [Candidatus Dojkabacteria bacterium]|nr:hypothetical protein [Candidatus Dojkabacteria bacterium]